MMCFKSNDSNELKSPISGPRSGTSVQVRKHRATAPAVAIGYLPSQPSGSYGYRRDGMELSPVSKVLRSNQGSQINRSRSARGPYRYQMEQDLVLIDIRTCELTRSQFIGYAMGYKRIMPDYEIFMDGDAYALVARRRHPSNNQR